MSDSNRNFEQSEIGSRTDDQDSGPAAGSVAFLLTCLSGLALFLAMGVTYKPCDQR